MKLPILFDPPSCKEIDFHPLPLPSRREEPKLLSLFLWETVRILWLVGLVFFVMAMVIGAVALGGLVAMWVFFPPDQ